MADYPNGGTPPTTFTTAPSAAPPAPLPNTGSSTITDWTFAGVIILACGLAVIRINKWYFWRHR